MATEKGLIKLSIKTIDASLIRTSNRLGFYYSDILPNVVCYEDGTDVLASDFKSGGRITKQDIIIEAEFIRDTGELKVGPSTGWVAVSPISLAEMLNVPKDLIVP